jgi:hypothetical protein
VEVEDVEIEGLEVVLGNDALVVHIEGVEQGGDVAAPC